MNPTRLLKRLLGAAALAATGVSADAAADFEDTATDSESLPQRSEDGETQRDEDAAGTQGSSRSEVTLGGLHADLAHVDRLVDGLGPVDPGLAAVLVGSALAAAHPMERIAFVCEWAVSPSLMRRRAVARALSQPFSCAGAVSALEVLVRDTDPLVRGAAEQAALLRLGHDPERYAALLERAATAGPLDRG
jgi:hypothetical protein